MTVKPALVRKAVKGLLTPIAKSIGNKGLDETRRLLTAVVTALRALRPQHPWYEAASVVTNLLKPVSSPVSIEEPLAEIVTDLLRPVINGINGWGIVLVGREMPTALRVIAMIAVDEGDELSVAAELVLSVIEPKHLEMVSPVEVVDLVDIEIEQAE